MQKSIMANGQHIGTYYPITGRLQYVSGKVDHMDKQTFASLLVENEWQVI